MAASYEFADCKTKVRANPLFIKSKVVNEMLSTATSTPDGYWD